MTARLMPVVAAVLAAACAAPDAGAASIVWTDPMPRCATTWSAALDVPRFDASLGPLQSVAISLTGCGWCTSRVENLSPTGPDCITTHFGAGIVLQWPDGSTLLSVSMSRSVADPVAAFDGTVDFLGPSGRTHEDMADCATAGAMLTAPGDLAPFEGTGHLFLPVTAWYTAFCIDQTGNAAEWCSTSASACVEATYTFDPAPEPATWMLLGAACGVIWWKGRATSTRRGPS